MFEKGTPLPQVRTARIGGSEGLDGDLLIGRARPAEGDPGSSSALRAVDWSELTARLGAARDLRRLLQRDKDRSIGDSAHDFADAAARYFRTKEEGQSNLNPVALGHRKGSPGMFPEHEELDDTETNIRGLLKKKGDARDD